MITLVRKLDTGDDSSERLDTEQEREQEQEQEKEVEARRTQQVMSISLISACRVYCHQALLTSRL